MKKMVTNQKSAFRFDISDQSLNIPDSYTADQSSYKYLNEFKLLVLDKLELICHQDGVYN